MITIYLLTYNEEVLLPFTTSFYRSRFPDARIVLYDNESTDRTTEIASDLNLEVIPYYTNKKLMDKMFHQIKNTCYSVAETSWVLVSDIDELLDINQYQLDQEISVGNTIIQSTGYDMVNLEDVPDPNLITHGVRNKIYDKKLLFDHDKVSINYEIGAHRAVPKGVVQYSKPYPLYHYKYLSPEYLIDKYAGYRSRLSQENKDNNWGGQCLDSDDSIRGHFKTLREQAVKIL